MASEMYHLIKNQVKSDDFSSSFNLQSGVLSETKHKQEHNVKRILCIGGSLAAVVLLIVVMVMSGTALPTVNTNPSGNALVASGEKPSSPDIPVESGTETTTNPADEETSPAKPEVSKTDDLEAENDSEDEVSDRIEPDDEEQLDDGDGDPDEDGYNEEPTDEEKIVERQGVGTDTEHTDNSSTATETDSPETESPETKSSKPPPALPSGLEASTNGTETGEKIPPPPEHGTSSINDEMLAKEEKAEKLAEADDETEDPADEGFVEPMPSPGSASPPKDRQAGAKRTAAGEEMTGRSSDASADEKTSEKDKGKGKVRRLVQEDWDKLPRRMLAWFI